MKHVVLKNPLLQGWEYGMLRAMEDEIVRVTGAEIVDIPSYGGSPIAMNIQHGTRGGKMRRLLPKKNLKIHADVVWCILMGPENYNLDLFNGWTDAKHRILYLFDTLPDQYALIKRLFSNEDFNTKITSFNDAQSPLENITGVRWHTVEQAATDGLFNSVPFEERHIHFSSYGRRWPKFHQVLLNFCAQKNLYYDFTTHDGKHPTASPELLYKQYAWHLNHSLFSLSWPVELTNPTRAGGLHPVTCRWFEAAASGCIVIGKKPGNVNFDNYLFPDAVIELDPNASDAACASQLEAIWKKRHDHFARANAFQKANYARLTWQDRVERIIALIAPKQERVLKNSND